MALSYQLSSLQSPSIHGLSANDVKINWGLWAAKWSVILLWAAFLMGAPFVLHAAITKKPGTVWAKQ